jgi:hypothetical protein
MALLKPPDIAMQTRRGITSFIMPMGPSLIFDKSSLESLNIDEAAMMDNFYMSTITPLFFVECLADLEKNIRSNSTPEQLVGSLADRTPDVQGHPNVHHLQIVRAELARKFDLTQIMGRVALAGGQSVQLGDKKGVIYKEGEEARALRRWSERRFLDVEREIAKRWRQSLMEIDFQTMVTTVSTAIGPWRRPKSLADAKQIADAVIEYLDPEFLLRFGLELLGIPEATEWVVNDWKQRRRPSLRQHVPYFVFLLTINIFFCLVLPTELLRNVKPSHHVDLAYLYYLPFCAVFTSKDNFHAQIVPLFLGPMQDFINGIDFKEDMRRLVAYYSALPDEVLRTGLINFAAFPPEDDSFFTTRMWDKYLPTWRSILNTPKEPRDPERNKRTLEEVKQMTESPELRPVEGGWGVDGADYISIKRSVRVQKGRWLRFAEDHIREMDEGGNLK